MTQQSEDLPAATPVGEYTIDRVIGRGGMGTVYAAVHPVIGKRAAIKVLSAQLSRDPELVRRFVDEARAVNKIGHPNIIDIFAFGGLPDGRQYFVMEYLDGQTLAARMARGGLSSPELERYITQTCAALEAAHRENIVHRDLKPENIWLAEPKHGESFVKVLDFGIAKLAGNESTSNVTQTGVAMGTPQFMSPEQCVGRNVDHRTDIYALGVMLYQIFSGRLPFEAQSFAEVVAMQITAKPAPPSKHAPMPAAVERLILACLDKDPAQRPQQAKDVATRLASALADAPNLTTRAGFSTSKTPASGTFVHTGRGRRVAVLALVALGVVAGATIAALKGRSHDAAAPTATPSPPTSPPPTASAPTVPAPPTTPATAAPSPMEPPPAAVEPRPAPAPVTRTETAPASTRRVRTRPGASNDAPTAPARTRVETKGLVTDNPFE